MSKSSPKKKDKKQKAENAVEPAIDAVAAFAGALDPNDRPHVLAKGTIRLGMFLFVVIFGFVGVWAAVAPLTSAAVAPGRVVLNQNKKTIQHLEGGIISELLVREGDQVTAGDPLVRLSDVNAKARVDILQSQLNVARASEARLLAIRDDKKALDFHPDLLAQKEAPETRQVLEAQERLFVSQQVGFKGQIDVMGQRVNQLRDEINGLKSRKEASEEQLRLIQDEIDDVKELVDRGLAQKPRLLGLQRNQAELGGGIGEFESLMAKAQQAIGENEIQMINLKTERINEVLEELQATQDSIADLEERIRAARDVMDRIVVVAPQSGVVTGLQYHTIGGVISPGSPIMEIVPLDDELIIEARVSPTDIDIVHAGLEARVRLTAFKVRKVPMLEGTVLHVSADSFVDQTTGAQFYNARVKVEDEALEKLKEVELYPGMPADVLIVTGSKTPLQYLFDPISDYALKAMREQ